MFWTCSKNGSSWKFIFKLLFHWVKNWKYSFTIIRRNVFYFPFLFFLFTFQLKIIWLARRHHFRDSSSTCTHNQLNFNWSLLHKRLWSLQTSSSLLLPSKHGTRGQVLVYQHFMRSFYARRYQNCKKDWQLDSRFYIFGNLYA